MCVRVIVLSSGHPVQMCYHSEIRNHLLCQNLFGREKSKKKILINKGFVRLAHSKEILDDLLNVQSFLSCNLDDLRC